MAVTSYSWPVAIPGAPPLAEDTQVSPLDRVVKLGANAHLGNGLLRPFSRDEKNDFAHGSGLALVRACVGQVLGTRASSDFTTGELPWNPDFGSLLYLLRHRANTEALQELARFYVVDALRRWEPRVRIKRTTIERKATADGGLNVLEIVIAYDVIQAQSAGNQVLLPDVQQTFQIAA